MFQKEPDYIFVADRSRSSVLTDQLETINAKYTAAPRDLTDEYGLLKGFKNPKAQKKDRADGEGDGHEEDEELKFLAYREYRESRAPEATTLVLVYFSDRILNRKAEEIGMRVHLQDKYQTLPFVLEAQTNFVRFNASQRYTLFQKLFAEEFDLGVLLEAKVISKHFMLHTVSKKAIG